MFGGLFFVFVCSFVSCLFDRHSNQKLSLINGHRKVALRSPQALKRGNLQGIGASVKKMEAGRKGNPTVRVIESYLSLQAGRKGTFKWIYSHQQD